MSKQIEIVKNEEINKTKSLLSLKGYLENELNLNEIKFSKSTKELETNLQNTKELAEADIKTFAQYNKFLN